jgi:predicted Zn-dependent protease
MDHVPPLALVDDESIVRISNHEFISFITLNPMVQGTPASRMVEKVGARMAAAVAQYLIYMGKPGLMNGYRWEFYLVDNALANAWCIPGGKVVIYSGILPYTLTEGGLATVMGHEIAHAIMLHGHERISELLQARTGGAPLSLVQARRPEESQMIFDAAFGMAPSTIGLLAFSRTQELEADELGLYFMTMAGYNPSEAVAFWQRISILSLGTLPHFLTTHPIDQGRIANIRRLVPISLQYYSR